MEMGSQNTTNYTMPEIVDINNNTYTISVEGLSDFIKYGNKTFMLDSSMLKEEDIG